MQPRDILLGFLLFGIILTTSIGLLMSARKSSNIDPAMQSDFDDIKGRIENMEEEDIYKVSCMIDDFEMKYQNYAGVANLAMELVISHSTMRDMLLYGLPIARYW